MLLVTASAPELRSMLADYATQWGYVVRTAASRADALSLLNGHAPVCAAIVQARLRDGRGIDVVHGVAEMAPLVPPMLLLVDHERDFGEFAHLNIPLVRCPPDPEMVRLWLEQNEGNAIRCALGRRAEDRGLTGRAATLFVLEGSGVRGAALQREMGAARSTVSGIRKRLRTELANSIDDEAALAKRTYKLPM